MRRFTAALLIVLALLLPALSLWAQSGTDLAMRGHADRVGTWTLLAEQVFGPLPALASTPFFGLAALCGLGLATDTAYFRETPRPWLRAVRDNALVAETRRYATWPRFLLLAVLALVGYLANSGKLQGLAGKGFRVFEDSSVLVGYTLLAIAALPGGTAPDSATAATTASIGGAGLLIPVATAFALAAMMAVRFAFDILVWLSPFPLVDLAFETAKKLATAGVVFLYLWSPGLATVLSLMVMLAALLTAGWAWRVLGFYWRILVNPAIAPFFPACRPIVVDAAQARQLGLDPRTLTLAAPAVAVSLRGAPRRQAGLLVVGPDGVRFMARRVRRTLNVPLAQGPRERFHIGQGLFWIELRVVGDEGIRDTIALSRALEPSYQTLCQATRAADLGSVGARGLIETAGELAGRALAQAEDRLR